MVHEHENVDLRQKPVRILYVHHFSGMGGATMSLYYIIEGLDKSRFYPIVLFLGGEGEGVKYFREQNIEVHTSTSISWYAHAGNAYYRFISRRPLRPVGDLLRIPRSVKRMKLFLQSHHIDLVHLNTSVLIPAALAAHDLGLKVVWHIREPLRKGWLGIRRAFVRRMIRINADAVIAISKTDAEQLGRKIHNVSVIYNYVDFNKFDYSISPDKFRVEWKLNPNEYVICNLGGVLETKGTDIYLLAAAEVVRAESNVKFLVVGYPDLKRTRWQVILQKLVGRRSLNEKIDSILNANPELRKKVIFTGIRNDIPEILAASDLLIWSASVSHFARPIVEAWSMKKAVIAADFPSSRELISAENGKLFLPGNHRQLADLILKTMANPEESAHLGIAGYQKCILDFNAEINAKRIYTIYASLLNES